MENTWNDFWKSGSVDDYLAYCDARAHSCFQATSCEDTGRFGAAGDLPGKNTKTDKGNGSWDSP